MTPSERSERAAATRIGITVDELRAHRAAGEKHCPSCREWLSLRRFNCNAGRYDGVAWRCRSCDRATKRSATPADKQRGAYKGAA